MPQPTGANLSGAGLLRCFFAFPADAGAGNLAAVVGERRERWSRPRRKRGDLNYYLYNSKTTFVKYIASISDCLIELDVYFLAEPIRSL
jgi:hypothetical protein